MHSKPDQAELSASRYLVCSIPRSGSTLLCHLLRSTRCLGMQPYDTNRFEYVLRLFRDGIDRIDWEATHVGDLLADAFRASATPNGVMGFKVMWDHFDRLITIACARSRDRARARREAEAQIASKTTFIRLRRRDEVRQAVSWAKALQSNAWHAGVPPRNPERFVYDFPGLMLAVHRIRKADAGWSGFFKRCDIQPLTLYYEDYLADRDATVAAVAAALDVKLPSEIVLHDDATMRQSDDVNAEWERRFRSDRSSASSCLRAMAAAVASPAWWSSYGERWGRASAARRARDGSR